MGLSGKSIKLLGLTAIFILVGLLASARWIWLPRILNSQDIKALICAEIQRATGFSARLESLELTDFSLAEVRGQGLVLESPEGGDVLMAPSIAVRLRWKDLLAGEVLLQSLTLDGLEIHQPKLLFPRDGKGRGGLGELGRLRLRNSKVKWAMDEKTALILTNIQADLQVKGAGQSVIFRLQGDMGTGAGEWPIRLQGSLDPDGSGKAILECDSMPLEGLGRLLVPALDMDRLVGKAELSLELQRDSSGRIRWSGHLVARELRVDWPGILDTPFETQWLKAQATGIWEQGSWRLQEGRINTQDLVLEGQLSSSVEGLKGVVRAGAFPFERVIPHLGRELIGPALYGFFREELTGGKGRGVVFTLLPGNEGSNGGTRGLLMELEFEDASLRFEPNLPPLEKLAGTLVWQDDKVWFKDLKGQYGSHPFTSMEARITEIGRVSVLEGKFSLELPWPELEELFSAVAPSKPKDSLLSRLGGSSILELSLRKAFLRKEALHYEAKIRIKGAWGELPGSPASWKVDSGEITATPKKLEIGSLKGTWDDSWWELAGSLENWGEDRPGLSFSGKMGISQNRLQAALLQVLPGMELRTAESIPLDFSIMGHLQEATASIHAELSQAHLKYGELWEKPLGDPLGAKLILTGSLGGKWNLEELQVKDGGASISLSRSGSGEGGLWNFSCPKCSVSELLKHWPVLRGRLERGEVEVKGSITSRESLSWDASIAAREVEISPEMAGNPVMIHSGQFRVNPWGITAESVQLEMESQSFIFSGSIQAGEQQKFRIQGGLRGEEIDLDKFLARRAQNHNGGKGSESREGPKCWIEKLEDSQLGLAFRSMRFLGLDFTGVQARISKKSNGISLEGFSGSLADGEVSMEGNLDPQGVWGLRGTLAGARSGEFLSALGLKEALIEGTLGIGVNIQGGASNAPPGHYRGTLSLEIDRGLIRRFPVLASVLSMMNLSQLLTGRLPDLSSEGMVFKSIRGTFQLDQGVLRTEDLRVESEAVVITMVGDIDLRSRQCDLKVGVQPFVGVDRFVDNIPVIRHYLAGPKRTVLATYFLVTGPLEQPEVNAIPFRSLGQTIMDMFLRLFQNPFADLGPPGTLPQESEAPYGTP